MEAIKNFKSPVEYLSMLPNISVDIKELLSEFDLINDKLEDVTTHGNSVLVQKKFHLMFNNNYTADIDNMPYTKSIANTVYKTLPFNSVNYRQVMPNTCYNWHYDCGGCCLHIPLVTNKGCFFLFERKSFHMAADGTVYIVNTSKNHTFVNAGPYPRLHLTFEIL